MEFRFARRRNVRSIEPVPATFRATVWEWIQAILLLVNIGWTTLCLGGYLAQTMVVTASLTAALLLAHGLSLVSGDPGDAARPAHRAGWLFLPFVVYAAFNVCWVTPVRWLGWIDWFGWVQLITCFWIGLNVLRQRWVRFGVVSTLYLLAVVAVLLACYQRFVRPEWMMLGRIQVEQYAGRASGPFGIPNSFAALLLMLLPLAGVFAFRSGASAATRVLFGWMTLVLLFGIGISISRGAWLGLGLALTIWPWFASRAVWYRRAALAGTVLAAFVAVAAVVYMASPRVRERLSALAQDVGERSRPILWRAALKMAAASPWVGTGGGSFNAGFEKYRPEGFLNQPDWAHNDYLNTLSDYGATGFVLFFGPAGIVTCRCLRKSPRRPRDFEREIGLRSTSDQPPGRQRHLGRRRDVWSDSLVHQGLAIGLLAFALQLFVDFHFKLPALAMTFATLAGLLVQVTWCDDERSGGGTWPRRLTGAICIGLGIFVVAAIVPRYRAEALRQRARGRIDRLVEEPVDSARFREHVQQARTELDLAIALAPDNAQAWSDRSYALAQWSLVEPKETKVLGAAAEAAAGHAMQLAPLIAEYQVRRGVARDMKGDWTAAGEDFTSAMSLSPKAVLPWFHYAYHLSLRPSTRTMALGFLEICLRLDPQNVEAQRLRQRLATGENRP